MSNRIRTVKFDEGQIDALFAGLDRCHLPGAAVGIAIGGKPVYRKGFGLASVELPMVLSPTMRMRIGSTTKHFTCLAYLLLCEDGKAHIDDPIGKYLPELHPITYAVTARQLMGNIGGLRDAHDIAWQFSGTGRPISSTDVLALYRDIDDVNGAPGTAWIYNNGGFLMLSIAIERISGQALEEVFRQRIFEPVGMYDTLLRRADTDFVSNSATLHMTNPSYHSATVAMTSPASGFERASLGTLAGEAGMVSTVDDMLRWLAHMDAPCVGSAATWTTMKTPQTLANGTSTGYGLGLVLGRYRGFETVSHPGGVLGGNSQMLKVPSIGLDVAIMVNRADVSGLLLVNNILDACLPGLDPVREAARGPHAAGTFRSPTTGRVIQLFTQAGQQMASIDGMDMPVEPDDDGVWWPVGVFQGYTKQAISLRGDRLQPAAIGLSDFGNRDELIRVEPPDIADDRAIAGQYRSDGTGVEATVTSTNDGARLTTVGRFGAAEFRLTCLAEGIWRARSVGRMPWGGILSFAEGGATFRFDTFRTWALPFRRIN